MTKIVYWVETKGKTIEEVDEIFDGQKHSNVPDIEAVRKGTARIDVKETEQQLNATGGKQSRKDTARTNIIETE
jgi:hypothetical protein